MSGYKTLKIIWKKWVNYVWLQNIKIQLKIGVNYVWVFYLLITSKKIKFLFTKKKKKQNCISIQYYL